MLRKTPKVDEREMKEILGDVNFRHFIRTHKNFFPSQEVSNPEPKWITSRCWKEIQALENLPNFHGFIDSFKKSATEFRSVFDAQEAHLWVILKVALPIHQNELSNVCYEISIGIISRDNILTFIGIFYVYIMVFMYILWLYFMYILYKTF